MTPSVLHEAHEALGGRFAALGGEEIVSNYGDPTAEYRALRSTVAVFDLGFRGRLCLTGSDRVRLLNGQVTNDIRSLSVGSGCQAVFCSPKGRLVADVHVFALAEELLLDFEPGLVESLKARLEHHIVAEDVQVVDVRPYYGLLSVQGPRADAVVRGLELVEELPAAPLGVVHRNHPTLGDLYVIRRSRAGFPGFDLFIPTDSLAAVLDKVVAAARERGGCLAGFEALDQVRFEAGIPRFPVDMDETNLPPEAGLEATHINYSKGCYTGQETIARLRTYGQVVKRLSGIRLPGDLGTLPPKGTKLFREGREAGYLTSVRHSEALGGTLALGYVRRESAAMGTVLVLRLADRECPVEVVALPFVPPNP
jgi:folate-binding protein YgfZ